VTIVTSYFQAFEDGMTKEELFELTAIDPWWLAQLEELHTTEVGVNMIKSLIETMGVNMMVFSNHYALGSAPLFASSSQ
jgi:hypothetical protein